MNDAPMTTLRVDDDIFRAFPDVLIGVAAFSGVDNAGSSAEVTAALRAEEDRAAAAFAGAAIPDHPRIAPWRAAYRAFGAKPKDHPSSIENLIRRVSKGGRLPHISKLVDLYNVVSLRHLVPVGGEDLAAVAGDVALAFAGEDEPAVRLLGEPPEMARPPKPGEVIYRDRAGALCRRWNWKEADRTKLTEATRDGFMVVEALPPVTRAELDAALDDLANMIRSQCGGEVRTAVLDAGHPETPLNGA
jgi:DNA/RNA-binding domain of Phe-tRNA-synthetase-like protein